VVLLLLGEDEAGDAQVNKTYAGVGLSKVRSCNFGNKNPHYNENVGYSGIHAYMTKDGRMDKFHPKRDIHASV